MSNSTTGEWTAQSVKVLYGDMNVPDGWQVVADAHNAALAAEVEQKRLEIWREAPNQADIQEAVIAKLDLVHRHAIAKAISAEREKVELLSATRIAVDQAELLSLREKVKDINDS